MRFLNLIILIEKLGYLKELQILIRFKKRKFLSLYM